MVSDFMLYWTFSLIVNLERVIWFGHWSGNYNLYAKFRSGNKKRALSNEWLCGCWGNFLKYLLWWVFVIVFLIFFCFSWLLFSDYHLYLVSHYILAIMNEEHWWISCIYLLFLRLRFCYDDLDLTLDNSPKQIPNPRALSILSGTSFTEEKDTSCINF